MQFQLDVVLKNWLQFMYLMEDSNKTYFYFMI